MADEVEIGGERLCNGEFNVAAVSPPATATPFIPDLTATPTPTEPPTIGTPTPTPTATPTEPAQTAMPTPTPTEAVPTIATTVQPVEIFVLSDPAGHAGFIGAMPAN